MIFLGFTYWRKSEFFGSMPVPPGNTNSSVCLVLNELNIVGDRSNGQVRSKQPFCKRIPLMTVQIDLSRDTLFDELGLMRLRESYMRPD